MAVVALGGWAVARRAAGPRRAARHPAIAGASPAPDARRWRRGVDGAAALLGLAVLADSALEHYRGSFHNPAMVVPLGVSALTIASSLRGALDGGDGARRDGWSDDLALATGVVGTGFHVYNIAKRPGGISWLNLFYAAPLGAPAALSLAGLLRRLARRRAPLRGVAPARLLGGLVAAGLIGTSAEAALLHFRGAFHNPAMLTPVTVPPVAALLLARAVLAGDGGDAAARASLWALTAVGAAGTAFHAYGIQRNMGGWRNWSQNLLNGPPLPAPPAFTALGVAGLAAMRMIEETER